MPVCAYERVLGVAELRDMVYRAVACPHTYASMRTVSKAFFVYHDWAMESLYTPSLFTRHFFRDAVDAVNLVQQTGAVMTGSSVRQFMYDFDVAGGWLIFMVNELHADSFLLFVESQGYKCYETHTPFDPVHPRLCRRALSSYKFCRRIQNRKWYVTVQVTLHEPMRTLFSTTKPYAMQLCDGWRFCDLYPKLGRRGPPAAVSYGKHTHLLTPKECIKHLPPGTFSLEPDSLSQPSRSFLERWIGDRHTWVVPVEPYAPSYIALVWQGWTICLNAQRVNGAMDHHFCTDTISCCLRHSLLESSPVAPPPAVAYARRVLDRMRDCLATGSPDILGPHMGVIEDYDLELDHIFDCYRVGFDYVFHASDETFVVERTHCDYGTWGFS